jgi:hypothetical protein
MELLKQIQQIHKIYDALNLIYNGNIREDYAGAYNLLKANPLAKEMIPEGVLKYIIECAKIQIEMQDMLCTDKPYTHVTNINGKIRYDVDASEIREGGSSYAYTREERINAEREYTMNRDIARLEYTAEWSGNNESTS